MSNDVEGRVRDALRSAPLPAAPESLRTSLLGVPSEVCPVTQGMPRRTIRLFSAAVVGIIVIALAGFLATGGRFSTAGATAGPAAAAPSTTPTAPLPQPPTEVQVLGAAELQAAIAAQRAGGLAPQDVVAGVGIDPTRQTPPLSRECVPVGACQVVGTLDGFNDPDGTVTIRQDEFEIPPPTTVADLAPPIALRLSGTAPIEYLGHLSSGGGTTPSTVPAAFAAIATAQSGQVIAVDGWLEGTGGGWSCGPAPMSGPPVPEPFRCHVTPGLMADPVKPVTATGNTRGLAFPEGSIPVQEGAYQEYAPSPANDGTNDEPRQGVYLIRMVIDNAANCPDCRGWLVVGRLDAEAAPAPTSSPGVGVTVRSAAELAALLNADRPSWLGRPVLVDGHVVPGTTQGCQPDSTCQIGTLDGTGERVVTSAYTASMLLPDTVYPTNGVMALIVRDPGLEYLGWMGYNNDNTFVFAVTDLQDPQHMARGPETVVVAGWLVDTPGAYFCPAQRSVPPDTPFQTCPFAWLTLDEAQPVTVNPGGGSSVTPPPNAIRVQPAAYEEFAPNPAFDANGASHVPRFGTYLVRLVSNPPSAADPQRGWQIVGRLNP